MATNKKLKEEDDITDSASNRNEVEQADIEQMTSIKAEGVHERLEDLELTLMAAPQEKAGALNRIVLLTGALKTALPDAITHVEDANLRADLEAILSLL